MAQQETNSGCNSGGGDDEEDISSSGADKSEPQGHVPLRLITYAALLRSLGGEAEALQKIHVRIQRQLQNLQLEERLMRQMLARERGRLSGAELVEFDALMQQPLDEPEPNPMGTAGADATAVAPEGDVRGSITVPAAPEQSAGTGS